MNRPLLTRLDLVFLPLLLAVILGFAWQTIPPAGAIAGRIVILAPGGEQALDPARTGDLVVAGTRGSLRLELRPGTVRIAESDCPRGICRHHGWLGGPDDVIVCVPNRVVIRRDHSGGLDAVTR